MKKTSFAFIAILALAASCQKNIETVEPAVISHEFTVSEEEWSDDAVKSSFTSGEGIALTGNETIAVGYGEATSGTITGITSATVSGGTYSFAHDAIDGAEKYNYYYVMPYLKTNKTNSGKTAMYVVLNQTQYPGQNTYDATQDYLIAKPSLNVDKSATITASDLQFKRLVAPFKLVLTDGANVLDGGAISSVEVSFPLTDNSHKKNNLINLIYLKQTEDCATSGASGYGDVTTTYCHNSVIASYPTGLTKDGSQYNVWYMVLPVEKAAGDVMTVTVKSGTKTVTRNITLTSGFTMSTTKINTMKVNISGSGYTCEDLDTNDYWALFNAGQDITVGDITINKATYPNATLLCRNAASTDMAIMNMTKTQGIYFVDTFHNTDNSDAADTCLALTAHAKVGATAVADMGKTVIIGRYKNRPSCITMNGAYSIYVENGDYYFKNLKIASGSTESTSATQLFITTNAITADIDKFVVEDCSITAYKSVYRYGTSGTAMAYAVKNITFNNDVINMAGTAANYALIGFNNGESTTPAGTAYPKFESMNITNSIVWSASPMASTTSSCSRRHLIDVGSSGTTDAALATKYSFKTTNLAINVTGNTIYNINQNGNIAIRANMAKSCDISKNYVYVNASATSTTKSTFFELYVVVDGSTAAALKANYNVKSNAGATNGSSEMWKWVTSNGNITTVEYPTYTTTNNKTATSTDDATLGIKSADLTTGKIVLDSANSNISDTGAGADVTQMLWL